MKYGLWGRVNMLNANVSFLTTPGTTHCKLNSLFTLASLLLPLTYLEPSKYRNEN